MKFKLSNHIIGKTYDLTQDNMNEMICVIEQLEAENARYREALEFIVEGRISASSIKHDYIDQAYQEIAREALKGEK